MTAIHHELCFGCGRANLFGLLLETHRLSDGAIEGHCFVKQDHQGPQSGVAHPGILATALLEAIVLAGGEEMELRRLELDFPPGTGVGVGRFCDVQADVVRGAAGIVTGHSRASVDDTVVGSATAVLADKAR